MEVQVIVIHSTEWNPIQVRGYEHGAGVRHLYNAFTMGKIYLGLLVPVFHQKSSADLLSSMSQT